jgi:hypothetical protein
VYFEGSLVWRDEEERNQGSVFLNVNIYVVFLIIIIITATGLRHNSDLMYRFQLLLYLMALI